VITALITQGEGIAWLPDFLVGGAVEAGKLVPVLPLWRPNKHQLWTCTSCTPVAAMRCRK